LFAFGLTVFWSNPSFAELYLYKKNGSYHITDSYHGSGYLKRYKGKKLKPESKKLYSNVPQRDLFNNKFLREINKASSKYAVNPNLITAVIDAESSFRPDVVSSKGAMGLMQIMPQTAKRFKLVDPFDPSQNIDCGARYLKYLLKRFRGNMRFALAAYNAGESRVKQYGTVPPFKETTAYVRKVLNSFKTLERKRNMIYKRKSPKGTIIYTDDLQTKFTQ
jgi:soluble lytic murein transglycosylase-like protein